jgi:peptidyl-prolyl cis-trans isomerase B (cyclophilin B)
MRITKRYVLIAVVAMLALTGLAATVAQTPGPSLVVVETSKGTFSFELLTKQAPVSAAHIAKLITSGLYNGQRIHRALPGFVVQFGDPQSKDAGKRDLWGRGAAAGSGEPVGVAEINLRVKHVRGTVALAHPGTPAEADSQIYITLAPRPDLDGRYAIIGQVVDGDDVLDRLSVGDIIEKVTLGAKD